MNHEDVRCSCRGQPLLGVLKQDIHGTPYFHVKSWKQQRLMVEIEAESPIRVKCRECRRWHSITPRAPEIHL